MSRLLLYSQHVLGVGHLFRVVEIARALAGHQVTLVTGGPPVELNLPGHITRVNLPGLMMDAEFSGLLPVEPGADMESIKEQRSARLLKTVERARPQAMLIELFPFGRKAFGFELLPVLDRAQAGEWGPCPALCSVRDILVEKKDPSKYQDRVLKHLNRRFTGVLVHGDPALVRLEETFPRADEIAPWLEYTGYITPQPAPGAREALRAELGLKPGDKLVLASAGSGSVGGGLLRAALKASARLHGQKPHRLMLFSGPLLPDDAYAALLEQATDMPWAEVARFSHRFLDLLAAADASLSMGGYNTTMNILAAGAPTLIFPFGQNQEQGLRAGRLAQRGALELLAAADLEPERLASRLEALLAREPRPGGQGIDLDGAEKSARLLLQAAGGAA